MLFFTSLCHGDDSRTDLAAVPQMGTDSNSDNDKSRFSLKLSLTIRSFLTAAKPKSITCRISGGGGSIAVQCGGRPQAEWFLHLGSLDLLYRGQ